MNTAAIGTAVGNTFGGLVADRRRARLSQRDLARMQAHERARGMSCHGTSADCGFPQCVVAVLALGVPVTALAAAVSAAQQRRRRTPTRTR